jgi:Aspartyl protease
MPCVWLPHNNSQIFLNVGIIDASSVNIAAVPAIGGTLPPPAMFKALIDTGAQKTMISTKVVQTLGLKSIGEILIQGVGPHAEYHHGYLFHVAFALLPAGSPPPLPGAQVQLMIFTHPNPIYGAELNLPGSDFDVLLGMDIISTGSLKIEGNGTCSFSF